MRMMTMACERDDWCVAGGTRTEGAQQARMRRWAKAGVLDKMFEELQREQVVRIRIEAVSLDSTSIKVHPDGTGALKKTDRNPSASPEVDGTPRFIWLPRMLERP